MSREGVIRLTGYETVVPFEVNTIIIFEVLSFIRQVAVLV